MNRVSEFSLRRLTVAIVFLCMTALTVCQVLGPTARLQAFAAADLSEQTYIGATLRTAGAQGHLPARCASIKLAPVEIEGLNFEPEFADCDLASALAPAPPHSTEISVPTPPPRAA